MEITPKTLSLDDVIFNNQGIDTIRQTANYKTVCNILKRDNLTIQTELKNTPLNPYINSFLQQMKHDTKTRYKRDDFLPVFEFVKIAEGKGLSNYMIIVRNTPELLDYAIKQKKAKDTYCTLIFTGLHQPTKHITAGAMRFISKMLGRKSFAVSSIDIATDFKSDEAINYQAKEAFKERIKPYSNNSYIIKGNSLYCNDVKHENIKRVLLYDKFKKQTTHQKQDLSSDLNKWQRLEITIKPTKRTGFNDFIASNEFVECLRAYEHITELLKLSEFKGDYLRYQITGTLDNRTLNSNEAKRRFNSVESLERFNKRFKKFKV